MVTIRIFSPSTSAKTHPSDVSVANYSFLNATTAKGGSVMAMECGR